MAAMASPLAARAYTAGGLSVGNRRSKLRCRQTMNVRAAIADAEESAVFRAWDSATSSNKRTDLQKIMILGAGPIVIGQACEFDYSGTQACKALRAEGYDVVLINSNPATIMTDPETADATDRKSVV